MEYPHVCKFKVNNVFDDEIEITLYSGLTTFVGPNGSGKTQTLKSMRNYFENDLGEGKVRYLSSNRLGEMEQYRSKVNQYDYKPENYEVGDRNKKRVRNKIETVSGDFFTMDDKKDVLIKVAERLSVLFGRQIYLRWDTGSMKVFFEKTEKQKEYSVAAEASGLVNVISILAAIFDDDIQVLLIDEPEVSLHPQLQSYLLREIKNSIKLYGKTVIISTHSTDLLSFGRIEEFSNLVFFEENRKPTQIPKDAPELKGRKLKDFLIKMGRVYKNGFFAKKLLLIEGSSDFMICHSLINRLEIDIDAAGSQLIPVEGKGQFPVISKLFRMLNKEIAILTDLDGFVDDNTVVELFFDLPQAKELAVKQGMGNISEIVQGIKTEIEKLVTKHKDDMKNIYQSHLYWINRKQNEDEIKNVKRAMIGQLFCTEDVKEWPDYEEWKNIKDRIEVLFIMLEKVGCFVLKKGAIESYYRFVSNTSNSEKTSAAAEEVSGINEEEPSVLEQYYSDIIKPLKYITKTKKVDESLAVKKELLTELPLALEILKPNTTEKEIYAAIKQAKGSATSLFNYQILNYEEKLGIKVDLTSKILEVQGFPFTIFWGENVNIKINETIKNKYS